VDGLGRRGRLHGRDRRRRKRRLGRGVLVGTIPSAVRSIASTRRASVNSRWRSPSAVRTIERAS
jgi:hypothetical protein